MDRLGGEARTERDVGRAALPVSLERVARDAGPEEEKVVEVRHAALGSEPTDVVDALARHPVNLVDRVPVEESRLAQPGPPAIRQLGVERLLLAQCVELGHQ